MSFLHHRLWNPSRRVSVAVILFVGFFSMVARGISSDNELKRAKMIGPRRIGDSGEMVVIFAPDKNGKPDLALDILKTRGRDWFSKVDGIAAYRVPDDTNPSLSKFVIRKDTDDPNVTGKLAVWEFSRTEWVNREVDMVDFQDRLGPLLRVIAKQRDGSYKLVPWSRQDYNGARWVMYEAYKQLNLAEKMRKNDALPKISDILTGVDENGNPRTQVYDWFAINPYDFNLVTHDVFSINLRDFRFDMPRVVVQEIPGGPLNSYLVMSYSITNSSAKTRVIRPRFRMIISTMNKKIPTSKIDNLLFLNQSDDYVKVLPEIGGLRLLSQSDFARLKQTNINWLIGPNNLLRLKPTLESLTFFRNILLKLGAYNYSPKDGKAPRLDGERMDVPGYVFAPGQTKHGLAVFAINPDMSRIQIIVEGLNNSYFYDNTLLNNFYKELSDAIPDYEEYRGNDPTNQPHQYVKKVLSIRLKRVAGSWRFEEDGVGAKSWEWVWDWASAIHLKEGDLPNIQVIDKLTEDYSPDTPEYEKKHVCHFNWVLKNSSGEAQSIRIKKIDLAVPITVTVRDTLVHVVAKITDDGYSSIYKNKYAKERGLKIATDRYQFRKTKFPRRWRDRYTLYPVGQELTGDQRNTLEGTSIFDLDDLDLNDLAAQVETYLGMMRKMPDISNPKGRKKVTSAAEALKTFAVRLTEKERAALRTEALKALVGDLNNPGELYKVFTDRDSLSIPDNSKESVEQFIKRWNVGRIQLLIDADVGPADPPVDEPTLMAIGSGVQSVMWYDFPTKPIDPGILKAFEGGMPKTEPLDVTDNIPDDFFPDNGSDTSN